MINATEKVGGVLFFLLRHAEGVDDRNKIEQVQKYIMDLDIKLKKYKKAYHELVERQKTKIGVDLEIEPLIEAEEELELLPELVETKEIIPPAPEIQPEIISQEMVGEMVDEEVVNVIKTFNST
jgi:hypothetical protein